MLGVQVAKIDIKSSFEGYMWMRIHLILYQENNAEFDGDISWLIS